MGKKSKSKTPMEIQDNAVVVEEEKPPSSAKKTTLEIDEVLVGKKKKEPETEKAEKLNEDATGKPPSSAKKRASEIDEIFAAKRRKKPETGKAKKPKDATKKTCKLKKEKKRDRGIKDGGFGDLHSQSKKRTQDGLSIYTEEELGINKADAGSTRLCPFDCSCCF